MNTRCPKCGEDDRIYRSLTGAGLYCRDCGSYYPAPVKKEVALYCMECGERASPVYKREPTEMAGHDTIVRVFMQAHRDGCANSHIEWEAYAGSMTPAEIDAERDLGRRIYDP